MEILLDTPETFSEADFWKSLPSGVSAKLLLSRTENDPRDPAGKELPPITIAGQAFFVWNEKEVMFDAQAFLSSISKLSDADASRENAQAEFEAMLQRSVVFAAISERIRVLEAGKSGVTPSSGGGR